MAPMAPMNGASKAFALMALIGCLLAQLISRVRLRRRRPRRCHRAPGLRGCRAHVYSRRAPTQQPPGSWDRSEVLNLHAQKCLHRTGAC